MKKISKLLFFSLLLPLVAACDSFMPNFNRDNQPVDQQAQSSSSSRPAETSSQKKVEKCTISWVDWDGETISSERYERGSWPTYKGLTPTRKSENGIDFKFTGWLPDITEVVDDKSYVAQYMTINSYEEQTSDKVSVKFLNWDGTILLENEYKKGRTPAYFGETPVRPNEGDIQYTFAGWCPELGPVDVDTNFVATFNSSYSQSTFTVKWVNFDGSVLQESQYQTGQYPSYTGPTPYRAKEGEIDYKFAGWSPSIQPVSGDATYVATYNSIYSQSTFSVKWLNYDGTLLNESRCSAGEVPFYMGSTPYKPNDGDIEYSFVGWNPTVQAVYSDSTYVAVFSSAYDQSTYTVKFLNWDGSVLTSEVYEKGAVPSYIGPTPTRESDGDINYTFTGWNSEPQPVYADATYVAVYSTSYNQSSFTVRWMNYDGTVLETDSCAFNEMPYYNGPTPNKPAEYNNNYVFTGWSPEVTNVTADVTYIAQFSMSNENVDYAVTWYDWNGNYLAQDYFRYGSMPEYYYGTPYRNPDTDVTYAFVGWEPELTEVTRNASYKAVYQSAIRQYEVNWYDTNGNLIYSEMVDYGAQLQYKGETPTKESNQAYHYTFTGWNNDYCYGNTDVYPNFSSTLRQYTVTWANYDGTVIKEDVYNYGDWPSFNGDTPTRDPEGAYSYSFSSWTPSRNNVYEDVTYTANYYENTRWVYYQFVNYEGNIFNSYSFVYGSEVNISFDSYTYSSVVPQGDSEHYYEFTGWDKEISNVANEDVTFNPVYEERNCVDNLILKLSQDGTHYVVVGYKDIPQCGHIGIPSEYNGLPITEIGNGAFRNCDQIRNLVMSNSVTKVGDEAFGWCYNINKFVLSENLKIIGRQAFCNISGISNIDICLPNVETIGDEAFAYCWGGSNTFTFGSSLSEIGSNALSGTAGNFVVENNDKYKSIDGIIYSKDGKELVACPYGKNVANFIVPDGVEKICAGAFRNNNYLLDIVFPDSLVEICEYAFRECRQLKNISLPDSVETLGNGAFSYCEGAKTITLGNNLKTIGSYAFENCSSVTSLVIPEGVTSIDYNAFTCCYKLKTIVIPSTVTYLGSSLFYECKVLEDFELPVGDGRIRSSMFYNCKNLTSIVVPEGVTNLEWACFSNCIALDEVTLPSTLTWISGNVFSGCPYMYIIRFNGTMEQWNALGKEYNWNENCGVTQIICTDGTINIGD